MRNANGRLVVIMIFQSSGEEGERRYVEGEAGKGQWGLDGNLSVSLKILQSIALMSSLGAKGKQKE